jgi:hypothetical protein
MTVANRNITLVDSSGNVLIGTQPSAASLPVVLASDQANIPSLLTATQATSFSPDPQSDLAGTGTGVVDASGNLQTRGQVLSDEGSLREDFSGTSLTTALTGTLTFTNGSTTVTGTGTLFTAELSDDYYIKKTADSETLYVRIDSVNDDLTLTLATPYAGTTATTTAVKSVWATTTTGGTITVSNSEVLLAASTANGNVVKITHSGDYLPYTLNTRSRITQRVANQTGIIGFQNTTTGKQAIVVFDGTSNTTLKFRTSSSSAAADIQETSITLSTGLDTSQTIAYQIDLSSNVAVLSINGNAAATHSNHIPGPYDSMDIVASLSNTAVVTATTLAIDLIYFCNLDQLQIANAFVGEPIKVIVTASTSAAGFSPGYVTTAAQTLAAIRATAYAEQAANAQRSIVSSSANDTNTAGTGARTVKITFFDVTGAGPYTETVALNGTTAVNMTSTNVCFIERMEVVTVGSTLSNVGTISLKAATAGGGATIGSIAATDNQTFWAHHYVPLGKTVYITDASASHNGTTVGSGGLFIIKAQLTTVANSVEKQITDFLRLYGQSSTVPRNYGTPIQVSGPARITMYVTPETASSTVYRGSFDYYDQ